MPILKNFLTEQITFLSVNSIYWKIWIAALLSTNLIGTR